MRISDWSSDVCSSDLRVLHDGVQQQFALHQRLPLVAQHTAQLVVAFDQLAQFSPALPGDAAAAIDVAIAGHAASERAEQRPRRREHPAHVVRSEEHTYELQSLMRI